MRILLDAHTVLWWWSTPRKLSARVLSLLKDPENRCYVSAASAWEITTKYRVGKLPDGHRMAEQWHERLGADGFSELPIEARHALKAGLFPGPHQDPFDRVVAAQAILEDLPIASC